MDFPGDSQNDRDQPRRISRRGLRLHNNDDNHSPHRRNSYGPVDIAKTNKYDESNPHYAKLSRNKRINLDYEQELKNFEQKKAVRLQVIASQQKLSSPERIETKTPPTEPQQPAVSRAQLLSTLPKQLPQQPPAPGRVSRKQSKSGEWVNNKWVPHTKSERKMYGENQGEEHPYLFKEKLASAYRENASRMYQPYFMPQSPKKVQSWGNQAGGASPTKSLNEYAVDYKTTRERVQKELGCLEDWRLSELTHMFQLHNEKMKTMRISQAEELKKHREKVNRMIDHLQYYSMGMRPRDLISSIPKTREIHLMTHIPVAVKQENYYSPRRERYSNDASAFVENVSREELQSRESPTEILLDSTSISCPIDGPMPQDAD